MFAQRRRGTSCAMLIGCACVDGADEGFGVPVMRENVAGEAGVFEISRRGPGELGSVAEEGGRG
jgi:hypothetical protein